MQEQCRYASAPLHRSPERGVLYAEYQQGIEQRKASLEGIKEQQEEALAAIREKWTSKRNELEKLNIAKENRRNLVQLARKREAEETARAKLAFHSPREAIQKEIPFTSWNAFLQHKAEQGNEIALAVLRSTHEAAEVERDAPVAPKKDWSQHGREQFSGWSNPELRATHTAKELAVFENTALTDKGKKALLAVLRMEQITEEGKAHGQSDEGIAAQVSGFKYSVDRRGIVLFTLPGGGIIRDTGKDVFFSAHDAAAAEIALRYGQKKWGKTVQIDGNHLWRGEAKEQKRSMER